MKTAIRLDDITPDMDFGKFNQIKAVLDEQGIRPLIGIVPYSKDETLRIEKPHEDFDVFLRSLLENGWTMALHGYNHLYTTRNKAYIRDFMIIKRRLTRKTWLMPKKGKWTKSQNE